MNFEDYTGKRFCEILTLVYCNGVVHNHGITLAALLLVFYGRIECSV